jgi:inosose dehydratase
MLSRRAVLIAGFAAPCLANPSSNISLGCQTNAWAIDPTKFDSLLSVLGAIRELGFTGFETGFRNLETQADRPQAARKLIEATGLQFFGIHIFLTKYDETTAVAPRELYEKVAATGAAVGAQRLILSGRPARDDSALARKVEGLNRAAAFAAKLGLKFAYHNHGPEFENSAREIEGLLRGTHPGTVEFLVDAGHAFRASADLPSFIRAHHARIAGLHLRDFRDGKQVPLGTGTFPLKDVVAALKITGWSGWVLAEEEREDGSKPGEKAARPALAAMRKELSA